MKQIKVIMMIALLSLISISCEETVDSDFAGKTLETTYAKMIYDMDGEDEVIEIETKEDLEKYELYWVLTLEEDGTFLFDGEEDGTWSDNGSSISAGGASLEIVGNQLKLVQEEEEDGVTIEMIFSEK